MISSILGIGWDQMLFGYLDLCKQHIILMFDLSLEHIQKGQPKDFVTLLLYIHWTHFLENLILSFPLCKQFIVYCGKKY